jgi:phosphoribosylglycinamide formyltransferase 1
MKRKRVGVLISGRGSNMAALVEAARAPSYPAEIACVVSNRPEAAGLGYARQHGITAHAIDHTKFARREAFDAELNACLQSQNLDIVACAGFMRIMTPALINPWAGRMINIHPSLLPLYRGTRTHERALADGAAVHGCTVHYVSHELDAGPIIAQARVIVFPGDTVESLSARVLAQEHKLYPKALTRVCVALDKAASA